MTLRDWIMVTAGVLLGMAFSVVATLAEMRAEMRRERRG